MTNNPNIVPNANALAQNIDYAGATDLLDLGRGIGAQFSGLPYSVYRVTSVSNGDYMQSANLIVPRVMVDRQKMQAGDPALETGKWPTMWFDVSADFAQFLTGDFFYDLDPVYGPGKTINPAPNNQFIGFCLASEQPIKNAVGARIDRFVQIFRPSYVPDSDQYLDQTFVASIPLICTAGVYAFGTNGQTASFIPAGFIPDRTERSGLVKNVPDMTPSTRWGVYIPLLNGFVPREGDIVQCQVQSNLSQPDRYRVLNPLIQNVGVLGNQLLCQKMIAQG